MRTSLVMTGVLLAALSLGCSSKSAEPPSGPGTVTVTATTTSTTTSIPTTTTTTTTSTIAPLPDLALFTPSGRFCRANSAGNLITQVLNQASGDAAAFVTRLTYAVTTAGVVGPLTVVNVTSPGLAPGVLIDVGFPGTTSCGAPAAGSSCTFTINVDAEGTVPETLEANNIAAGTCP
jgi:hypothetical protein